MINPGTYIAKIIRHAISETKKGIPQAVVSFDVDTPSGIRQITYYGSFSEKAAPYTIKNLIIMGLKGTSPASDIEIGKQVELVIDIETGDDGKERNKVKFINEIGAVRNAIPQDMAKAKLSHLEGLVMKTRSSENVSDPDAIPF